MKDNLGSIGALLALFAFAAGCAPTPLEADFGNSVRHITQQQISDMNSALNPDDQAITGGDPYRLNESVSVHQTDVSKPAEVNNAININIGN